MARCLIFVTMVLVALVALWISPIAGRRSYIPLPKSTNAHMSPSRLRGMADEYIKGNPLLQKVIQLAQNRSTLAPKADSGCACAQLTCQSEEMTYPLIGDQDGECFVISPQNGIKETLCTGDTYLKQCPDALVCGGVGGCNDAGFVEVNVIALCFRTQTTDVIFPTFEIPTTCCCS